MPIQIVGKHMDVGEALSTHIKSGLKQVVDHSVGEIDSAHVVIFKDHFEFVTELSVHITQGLRVHCKGHHPDPYKSYDAAQSKLAKRLRRYTSRLKDRRRHSESMSEAFANQYIICSEQADAFAKDTPMVIAEMKQSLKDMTVSDAVMHMDLGDSPVYVFKNSASGVINVVYKRSDGNIGWIDPELKK